MKPSILVLSDYSSFHTARPEAEIFVSLSKLGYRVVVMTPHNSEYFRIFQNIGVKVIDFLPKKKFDKSEIELIRSVLIEEKIDVFHIYNSKGVINGIRAAKGLATKVVLYRGYSTALHWYDPTEYLKFFHPRVDKIICNSIGVEELFHRQLFFDKSKTFMVNKGHELSWYEGYPPIDIKKELGLPKESFLLVCVANNRKMKGIPYLLEAMNNLSEAPIHLLLIGNGMDTEANLAILDKGTMKAHVHILQFRKDVLNIVAASDVFVLSSITGESITKSVIEAMALGVAPIISDIPGNRELVVNGESGLVFPSKNPKALSEAILKLYHDRDLCKSLGVQAKLRIKNVLNHKQTVDKMVQFYDSL